MRGRWKKVLSVLGLLAAAAILMPAILTWMARPALAPWVSVDVLGYTNRVGPYAILAITNRSAATITLDGTCLIAYSPTRGISPRRPNAFDANKTAMTRLDPQHGFVQEVFVFPASKGEWRFECYAARSSVWLDARRSIERRTGGFLRRIGLPLTAKAWHKIQTDWRDCPP